MASTGLHPDRALQRLIDGNRRFRDVSVGSLSSRPWNARGADDQTPFAVVLGCSDSRTPVEILFDQGLGDLFVVRVAGNIVAPSIVGSIEFAVSQFGVRLVVVMGHTRCGAITATASALKTGLGPESKSIRSITDRIAPHIEQIVYSGEADGPMLRRAGRANVKASLDHLRHGSKMIEELVESGGLVAVGAEYELETGEVHFFDAPSPSQLPIPLGG